MKRGRASNSTPRVAKDAAPKKSGKQKKAKLEAKRLSKRKEAEAEKAAKETARMEKSRRERQRLIAAKKREGVHVDFEKLNPKKSNSYDWEPPGFMKRGYYIDIPFVCKFCGASVVFTPKWQKWWYETVQADVWTRFDRCEPCQLKLKAAKEAKQKDDAIRTAKNKIRKLRAAGKLTPEFEKEILAAARK